MLSIHVWCSATSLVGMLHLRPGIWNQEVSAHFRARPARSDATQHTECLPYTFCFSDSVLCSLPIHIPQCIKKWEDVEALKPPRERRPVPPPPIGQDPLGAMPCKGRDIQAFNEAMYQQFEEMSLEHCEFCGRSFK